MAAWNLIECSVHGLLARFQVGTQMEFTIPLSVSHPEPCQVTARTVFQ